jgi:hypothetical protein
LSIEGGERGVVCDIEGPMDMLGEDGGAALRTR